MRFVLETSKLCSEVVFELLKSFTFLDPYLGIPEVTCTSFLKFSPLLAQRTLSWAPLSTPSPLPCSPDCLFLHLALITATSQAQPSASSCILHLDGAVPSLSLPCAGFQIYVSSQDPLTQLCHRHFPGTPCMTPGTRPWVWSGQKGSKVPSLMELLF